MSQKHSIDYSKWDNMDFSDDDSDQEEDVHKVGAPRVTRLDKPSSVTCAPDGNLHIQPTVSPTTTETKEEFAIVGSEISGSPDPENSANSSVSSSQVSSTSQKPRDETAKNSIDDTMTDRQLKLFTKNGGAFKDPVSKYQTYWNQDRHEVILTIAFEPAKISSRDISVKVTGALPYTDRHSAIGSGNGNGVDESKGSLTVYVGSNHNEKNLLLRGDLPHFIHLPEEEEEIDWEIDVTNPKMKFIRITLLKAVPMQGLTLWWTQPLLHFPEINTQQDIHERNTKNISDGKTGGEGKNAQQKLKANWDEAHRMFRERVQKREKMVIDDS